MGAQLRALWGWFDARMPSVAEQWKINAATYYAPKNFNFWYFFGALSMLVLGIQIVSGIFLTMNYKPDANLAFGSVEYINARRAGRLAAALHPLDRRLGVLRRRL